MKISVPVLALLLATGALGVDRHKPDVDPESQDGILLQRIQQERPFDGHAAARGGRLQFSDLLRRKSVCVVQKPADQGGLAVIDVADHDDLQCRRLVLRRNIELSVHHM